MQGMRISALLAAVMVTALAAPVPAQQSSRGVEVLRPTARPIPAPTPTPSPTPVAPEPAPPPAPPPPRSCPRPFATTDLALRADIRQAQFDSALRNRFRAKAPRVTIDLATPFPLGTEGPTMLSAWLRETKAKGGIVSVDQYCETPRGLFGWLRKVFGGGEQTGYDAVDGYDAVLHADGANGVVTQVEFRRRTGA